MLGKRWLTFMKQTYQFERTELRSMLRNLFNTDVDFEAFCVDYFLEIQRTYFSARMERIQKETILLQCVPQEDLEAALVQVRDARPPNGGHLLHVGVPRPAGGNASELSRQLQILYEQRERAALVDRELTDIDKQIRFIRREQRQGPQLHAGEVLAHRYVLDRILGQGGFAVVWRVYDRQERSMVALKILHGQWSQDATRIERFYRSARRMAGLCHRSIVRVIDQAREDDGFHFFAMEYLSRGDLRHAILEKRCTYEQAVSALLEVCDALAYTHRRGIVHRDVKPANILLDEHGHAKLGDFDLIYVADSTGGTRTGPIGTVFYAPPEAMENAQTVTDPRSDIFSLGMTLAFILHGRDLPQRSWTGRTSFLLEIGCPPLLREVITKATAALPSMRFADAESFAGKLREGLASHPNLPAAGTLSAKILPREPARRLSLTTLLRSPLSIGGLAAMGLFLVRQADSGGTVTTIRSPVNVPLASSIAKEAPSKPDTMQAPPRLSEPSSEPKSRKPSHSSSQSMGRIRRPVRATKPIPLVD